MAYMSQENKKSKEPLIKALLKKYGLKGSVGVKHHSTLVVNIKSGCIDFIGNYNEAGKASRSDRDFFREVTDGHIQVNPHWCQEHFTGRARDCLKELVEVMGTGNHDNSDIQTDYFDVGWYSDINIGKWDEPYTVTK